MGEVNQKSSEKRIWMIGSIAIVFGLVGLIDLFFRLEINEFQFFMLIYPTVSFFVGVISYFLFKNVWMGPAMIFTAGFLSMILYVLAILVNVVIYSVHWVVCALIAKGLVHLKHSSS